jgi:D-alanine-D-alanine ligase
MWCTYRDYLRESIEKDFPNEEAEVKSSIFYIGLIDFLMDSKTGKVYVNEINTIPGALSYYLWEATGKSFEKEIDELVQIALRRDRDKNKLTFSYDQNIFALSGGAKGGTKGSKVSKK